VPPKNADTTTPETRCWVIFGEQTRVNSRERRSP
jgi:hypothetical protein